MQHTCSNQITEIPRLTGMDYPSSIDLFHNQITVLPRELIDNSMPTHDVDRVDDYKIRLDISGNPLRRVEVDVSNYFHTLCLITIDEGMLPLFSKHANFPPAIQTMDLTVDERRFIPRLVGSEALQSHLFALGEMLATATGLVISPSLSSTDAPGDIE